MGDNFTTKFCRNDQECEENLPTELVKQMMTGSIAYCEACGAQLHELSGKVN